MSSDRKSTAPPHPPRLCNVVRSPTFSGYGFNLHTIKNKTGQYIGHVDEGSPAEKALLKQGDRIVEVNGVNIASENHKQVVSRIKLVPNETNLLVVDDEGDAWYKERNIIISSELPEVVRGSSVARRPSTSSSEGKPARSEDRRSVASVSSASNSEASNRQEIQEEVVGAATSAAVVDSDADSVAEVSVEKEINGDSKSAASVSDDDNEADEEKVPAPRVKEIVAVATNGNHEDKTEIAGKSAESSDSEESEDEDKTTTNNTKNNTTEVVQKIAAKESVAEKPTLKKVEDEDRDSESEKSRSVSVSSASSRGSAGHSRGTNPVVNKSPVSTSPSPPSSVGAPSPTPVYTFPNVGGLNLNMTAAEMREMITAKKKKDIRNTEIDLRKKYEIVQKL